MPFSFYDILDESSEEEQFNSNVLLEDEFDIDTSLDDVPKPGEDQGGDAGDNSQQPSDGDQQQDGYDQQQDDGSGYDGQEGGDDGSGEAPQDDQGGGEDSEDGEEPVEANTDIFDSLSADEQKIKIMELQRLYGEMYNSCDDISKRLNDLNTDESNIDIISRVSDSMNILKKYIQDYLIGSFAKKSYVENDIMYNRFLSIISSLTAVLDQLSHREKKQQDEFNKVTNEITEHNGKKNSASMNIFDLF